MTTVEVETRIVMACEKCHHVLCYCDPKGGRTQHEIIEVATRAPNRHERRKAARTK